MSSDAVREVPDDGSEDRPPIFRSWQMWYGVILLELVLLVLLFRVITVMFR